MKDIEKTPNIVKDDCWIDEKLRELKDQYGIYYREYDNIVEFLKDCVEKIKPIQKK